MPAHVKAGWNNLISFHCASLHFVVWNLVRVQTAPDGYSAVSPQSPPAKSRISHFVTGQQGEVCPVPGEGVPGENQPILHVWRPREENPRVQAAAPELPARHHHVQPYVLHSCLIAECQKGVTMAASLSDNLHDTIWRVLMWQIPPTQLCSVQAKTKMKNAAVEINFLCIAEAVNRTAVSSALLLRATWCWLHLHWKPFPFFE